MKDGRRHGVDSLWDPFEGIIFALEYSDGVFIKSQVEDLVAKHYKLL